MLLLLSCPLVLFYFINLVFLFFCFSSLAWGPRWVRVCAPDYPVLGPPLDIVTICCSLVPKLRPTRLYYIDLVVLSSCSYVLLYSFAWSFVLLLSGSGLLSFVYLALFLYVSSSSCFSCYLALFFLGGNVLGVKAPTLGLIILSRVPLFSCIRYL